MNRERKRAKVKKEINKMRKTRSIIAALLVAVFVLGGSNSLATHRTVVLQSKKSIQSKNSCTAKNGKYKVFCDHGKYSRSAKLSVGLKEWSIRRGKYVFREDVHVVPRGDAKSKMVDIAYGNWAYIRLTASGSTGIGSGFVTNEF